MPGNASTMQGRKCPHHVFQLGPCAAQNHGKIGRCAGRELQHKPRVLQACCKPRRANPVQQFYRRYIERQSQRFGRTDGAIECFVEVAGPIAVKRLRCIQQ